MTANAFIEDKQRSKEVGINEHLSKLLDEKTLLDMIWKYMPERRNSRGC